MQNTFFRCASVAVLLSIATPVFAESAPVYDADTMQQQFDNAGDAQAQAQDFPPPPAPGQEGVFVPAQSPAPPPSQPSPIVSSAPAAPAPSPSSLSLEQRVRKVEAQVTNSGETSNRVESLQNEVQSLRGQVEQLNHQLQQLQNQQKNMYSDLDKRVTQNKPIALDTSSNDAPSAIENTDDIIKPTKPKKPIQPKVLASNTNVSEDTTPPAAPVVKTENNQPNVAEEQQIYQTAYNLIKAKKYSEAVGALQKMLQKYPSGQFASNAHYWLGELYGLLGKNDQSLTEFSTVVKSYQSSPRVSDAQLKIGLIYASQSKWSDAKGAFKKVINRYPGTASSRLASEQLKQIKQAGH